MLKTILVQVDTWFSVDRLTGARRGALSHEGNQQHSSLLASDVDLFIFIRIRILFFFFSRTDPDLDRTFEFRYGSESIQAKTIPVPFLTGVFKKMFTIMFVEHAKKM